MIESESYTSKQTITLSQIKQCLRNVSSTYGFRSCFGHKYGLWSHLDQINKNDLAYSVFTLQTFISNINLGEKTQTGRGLITKATLESEDGFLKFNSFWRLTGHEFKAQLSSVHTEKV